MSGVLQKPPAARAAGRTTVSFENLRELLEARAAASPEKVFLFSESDGRRFTYREFDAAVNRAANMLAARGVGRGDAVNLLLPNSAEYVIAYFACFKLGALAGPVNSLLKPEEAAYVVGNSEARLLLYGSQFAEQVAALPPVAMRSAKRVLQHNLGVGLEDALRYLQGMFPGQPIFIIENGTAGPPNGTRKTRYFREHVRAVQRAHADGVNVIGYLAWSLTTNHEWGLPHGPAADFGLYHIDLESDPTLTRKPTPASVAYRAIVQRRGA